MRPLLPHSGPRSVLGTPPTLGLIPAGWPRTDATRTASDRPRGQHEVRPTAAGLIVERGLADRLRELEARQDELSERLASVPADIPDVRASAICRRKVEHLSESLRSQQERDEVADAIQNAPAAASIPNIRAKLPQGALDRDRKCSLGFSSHNVYLLMLCGIVPPNRLSGRVERPAGWRDPYCGTPRERSVRWFPALVPRCVGDRSDSPRPHSQGCGYWVRLVSAPSVYLEKRSG